MTPGELDSLLERAAEIPEADALPEDLLELARVARKAIGVMLELRTVLRDQVAVQGGTLGQSIRAALEEKIVEMLNGRARLTPETTEHTLSVHVLPDEVIVDVRLRVGKAKEK